MKAKWIEDGHLSTHKSAYSPRKNVYGDADWAWVRGWAKRGREKNPNSSYFKGVGLWIEVMVWPGDHQPADLGLTKKFGETELNQAKKYAREMVEAGRSVMSEVRGVMYEPWRGNKTVVTWGTYEAE